MTFMTATTKEMMQPCLMLPALPSLWLRGTFMSRARMHHGTTKEMTQPLSDATFCMPSSLWVHAIYLIPSGEVAVALCSSPMSAGVPRMFMAEQAAENSLSPISPSCGGE